MPMPRGWEKRLPKELRYDPIIIMTHQIEDRLRPLVRRNRRFYEYRAVQFTPWYQASSGRRYKLLWMEWCPIWYPSRMFVVDQDFQPAPHDEAKAALRELTLAATVCGGPQTRAFRMYIPENQKISNSFIATLDRWREAIQHDPEGQPYLAAVDHSRQFWEFWRDSAEKANGYLVQGFVQAREFQERFRQNRFDAVVYPGEAEAIFETFIRFANIRWYWVHKLKPKYYKTWYKLNELRGMFVWARRLGLTDEEIDQLYTVVSVMGDFILAINIYKIYKSGRDAVLSEIEGTLKHEVKALAIPR